QEIGTLCNTMFLVLRPASDSPAPPRPPKGTENRFQPTVGCSLASSWPSGGEGTASAEVFQCHALRFRGFPTNAFLRAMDGYIFRFHGEDYDLQALHSEVEKLALLLDSRE